MMNVRKFRSGWPALLGALFLVSQPAWAIDERLDRRIPYQGKLTGVTGTATLSVELFDSAEGGDSIWGPEPHQVTPDADGRFVIVIGSSELDQCSRAPFGRNLIENPGNEAELVGGEIPGWTEVLGTTWGHYPIPNDNPPFDGDRYFYAGLVAAGELAQNVDVSDFASEIDAGLQSFAFLGRVAAFVLGNDQTEIVVDYLDQNENVLESFPSGPFTPGNQVWETISDTRVAPVGTRIIRVRLLCTRLAGSQCDGYFDGLSLVATHASSSSLLCESGGDGISDLDQIEPSPLFVNVTVDDGNEVRELSPRQQLFPAYHASSATAGVAVGTVLMWWGQLDQIPPGFELCNGDPPSTAGATLVGNKPDLRGRFPRGAPGGITDVATVPISGGSDTAAALTSGGTALSQAHLPDYTLPDTFSTNFRGSHQHSAIHSCASNEGGGDSHYALGDSNSGRNCPLIIGSDGNHTHSVTGSARLGGGGGSHSHSIPSHDNRPAYLDLFFIIRVK